MCRGIETPTDDIATLVNAYVAFMGVRSGSNRNTVLISRRTNIFDVMPARHGGAYQRTSVPLPGTLTSGSAARLLILKGSGHFIMMLPLPLALFSLNRKTSSSDSGHTQKPDRRLPMSDGASQDICTSRAQCAHRKNERRVLIRSWAGRQSHLHPGEPKLKHFTITENEPLMLCIVYRNCIGIMVRC